MNPRWTGRCSKTRLSTLWKVAFSDSLTRIVSDAALTMATSRCRRSGDAVSTFCSMIDDGSAAAVLDEAEDVVNAVLSEVLADVARTTPRGGEGDRPWWRRLEATAQSFVRHAGQLGRLGMKALEDRDKALL